MPVNFINHAQSPGLKRGGVLNVVRHEVEMVCRADSIPDHLTVDLTGHDIGTSIHISMIEIPEGARPAIRDRDFTVATVAAPTIEAVVEPTAAETAATEGAAAEVRPPPRAAVPKAPSLPPAPSRTATPSRAVAAGSRGSPRARVPRVWNRGCSSGSAIRPRLRREPPQYRFHGGGPYRPPP